MATLPVWRQSKISSACVLLPFALRAWPGRGPFKPAAPPRVSESFRLFLQLLWRCKLGRSRGKLQGAPAGRCAGNLNCPYGAARTRGRWPGLAWPAAVQGAVGGRDFPTCSPPTPRSRPLLAGPLCKPFAADASFKTLPPVVKFSHQVAVGVQACLAVQGRMIHGVQTQTG